MARGRVRVGIPERARRSRALLRSGPEVNRMALIAWGPVANDGPCNKSHAHSFRRVGMHEGVRAEAANTVAVT